MNPKHFLSFIFVGLLLIFSTENSTAQNCVIEDTDGSPPGYFGFSCSGETVYCLQQNKNWCFNSKHQYTVLSADPGIFSQTCEVSYLLSFGAMRYGGPFFPGSPDLQDAIWSFTNSKAVSGNAAAMRQGAIVHCGGTGSTTVSLVSRTCSKTVLQITTNELAFTLDYNNVGMNLTSNDYRVNFSQSSPAIVTTFGATIFTIEIPSVAPITVNRITGTPANIKYYQDLDPTDTDAPNCQILGSAPVGTTMTTTNLYSVGAYCCTAALTATATPSSTCIGAANYSGLSTNVGSGYNYTWSGPDAFSSMSANPYIGPPMTAAKGGTYTVTAAITGCTNSSTATVALNVIGGGTLNIESNSPICEGSKMIVSGMQSGNYSWAGPSSFTSTEQVFVRNSVTATMAGVYTATATVGSGTCTATATGTINISTQSCTAATGSNLSLKKMVSKSNPNHGDNITYTFIITNAGPQPATGVKVKDVLPPGLTFVSVSEGTYTAGTGQWDIGNVAVGQKIVTMTVTVN